MESHTSRYQQELLTFSRLCLVHTLEASQTGIVCNCKTDIETDDIQYWPFKHPLTNSVTNNYHNLKFPVTHFERVLISGDFCGVSIGKVKQVQVRPYCSFYFEVPANSIEVNDSVDVSNHINVLQTAEVSNKIEMSYIREVRFSGKMPYQGK